MMTVDRYFPPELVATLSAGEGRKKKEREETKVVDLASVRAARAALNKPKPAVEGDTP